LAADQPHQTVDELAGPAHGEMDAPAPFQIGD
jgi:hypothetical protein